MGEAMCLPVKAMQLNSRMRSLWVLVGLVFITQSAARSQVLPHDEGYCQNEQYARQLHAYRASKKPDYRMGERSASGDLELRFYIDTSYERRRAGGYNRNDSVQNYLRILVDSVRTLFNRAAPVWDLGTDVDFVFFDGATPFGYGISPAETLINFYEWLDSQGFPGSKDSYVFYSGKYTNQGVSFVGEMCLPGSAMVGYVSDFNSNVNLSSHEWIGHNANS
ncbi:MAG TPA: hypothetical protein VFX48_02135, partial [Saprospiraceae bacterium]|nr:hypothetical protein [Saprospiraceae bacterium]